MRSRDRPCRLYFLEAALGLDEPRDFWRWRIEDLGLFPDYSVYSNRAQTAGECSLVHDAIVESSNVVTGNDTEVWVNHDNGQMTWRIPPSSCTVQARYHASLKHSQRSEYEAHCFIHHQI